MPPSGKVGKLCGKGASIPARPSQGEETFAFHCAVHKLSPTREHVFHPDRKWRIDFAWPDLKLAVEVESSVHRIRSRFGGDLDKYNALVLAGWTLLRYTRKMIETGAPILEVAAVVEQLTKKQTERQNAEKENRGSESTANLSADHARA